MTTASLDTIAISHEAEQVERANTAGRDKALNFVSRFAPATGAE
jgi:hypothetical protein